jgi:hypothetical protein
VGEAEVLRAKVLAALQAGHPDAAGVSWFDTSVSLGGDALGDWFVETPVAGDVERDAAAVPYATPCAPGSSGCDPDFGIEQCSSDADCAGTGARCVAMEATRHAPADVARKLCAAPADMLYERMARIIMGAQQRVEIVSLSLPEGRFRTAVRNALAVVGQREAPPSVRLLFGGATPNGLNMLKSPSKALDELSAEIAQIAPAAHLQMQLGWLSSATLTWNHAKILAADGRVAVVGGHNMYDAYYGDRPAHDLSLVLRGGAAAAAAAFADSLWQSWSVWSSGSVPEVLAPEVLGMTGARGDGDLRAASDAVPALVVGRLAALGDDASDDALIALIDAAEHSVVMSAQDFYNEVASAWTESVLVGALARAAQRGVSVEIVQSPEGGNGDYGMVSPATSWGKFLRRYEALTGEPVDERLCETMHWATFRYSGVAAWPDGTPTGAHDKFLMVDDAAFYVGSQNPYPAHLIELGTIVFSAERAATVRARFWQPLWARTGARAPLPCLVGAAR